MDITGFRTPGLGDSTYVLTHDGAALLVDPQRDVDRFLGTLEDDGIELAYVLETHLHNDYLSGGRQAAARTGAGLVLPASSGAAFRHVPAFHMEDLEHEAFTIRPIHTPGHTPEHTSYLVIIDGVPVALFSGGSLLVGSAGRPDLLGMAQADTLARLQYGSVNRLARLGDDIGLYPTHGEGSFCTASGAGQTTSTIGAEKATNPVLNYPDENAFVTGQLAGLQPYPDYYAHMGPGNLFGPEPLPRLDPPALDPGHLRRMQDDGYVVVDARTKEAFIDGHIPGALGVELRDDFGTWVGWLAEYNAPMVLVLDEGQDAGEAIVQLNRIGFDRIEGIMWGLGEWILQGYPVDHLIPVSAQDIFAAACRGEQVLDVRSPVEWDGGHLEGSTHVYVPEMVGAIPESVDPEKPVWLMCGSGYRAAIAGGLLRRHGLAIRVFAAGGVDDVERAGDASDVPCDLPLLVKS
jgi:glyoxylase-like metal-dependent hydrolase (beta-lactamase superfamily II)/rhodanese-related sulfurtransferase